MPQLNFVQFVSASFIRPALDGQGVRVYGSTSGYVGLAPAAAAGSVDYTLPSADGTSGYVLQTNGSGTLSWVAQSGGSTDHGALTGLADDDHSQYALLAGRSGGQTIDGDTAASGDLTLNSTSNATQGYVRLNQDSGIDSVRIMEVGNGLRIYGATTGYIGLKAPASFTGHVYTLPSADGTNGQVLQTNGSATLSWTTASGSTDHGALTGLADDDHSQYALLAGRSGGQTMTGGTAAGEDFTINSTSNASKGSVFLAESGLEANTAYTYINRLLRIQGATSGYVGISVDSVAGSTTYTLPSADGTSGYVLQTNGSGTLSWVAQSGGTFPLDYGASKTASYTAAAGDYDLIDLSGVTADVTITFPPSPSAGNQFGYAIIGTHSSGGTSASFNDRPFFSAEPVNLTSINGSSYTSLAGSTGGGPYSLWKAGESMRFMYTGSTWVVMEDGRIPFFCKVALSSNQSITTGSGPTINFATSNTDELGMHSTSTTTDRVYIKRLGDYSCMGSVSWASNSTGLRHVQLLLDTQGALFKDRRTATSSTVFAALSGIAIVSTAAAYFTMTVYQDSGSTVDVTPSPTSIAILEVL